jgi:outer membrane protein
MIVRAAFAVAGLLIAGLAWADTAPSSFRLSLQEAEQKALQTSNQLKSYESTTLMSVAAADSQFASLLPRLTANGAYGYTSNVPSIALPIPGFNATIPFGTNSSYSVGVTLGYTLWDTGAARRSYQGQSLLAQARDEDRKGARLQLLLSVRSAYLKVQLAMEELRLLNGSLELSRAQNRDIESNYRAGAATRLDRVDSQRDVINYELQFEQKQAELASDFKDLLALTREDPRGDFTHPGPADVPGVRLVLALDPLSETLRQASQWRFAPPDESHPQVRGQELLAQSSDKLADSAMSTLYPTVQVGATAEMVYPNVVLPERVEQNLVQVAVSMPLFEGDRTRHLAEERRMEADSARYAKEQDRIDLDRDYAKALQQLESLREQQRLSADDVQRSEDAARLYYQSYHGGTVNLIDVQSANNRALQAKVNAARIDAQVLSQIFILKSISGESPEEIR